MPSEMEFVNFKEFVESLPETESLDSADKSVISNPTNGPRSMPGSAKDRSTTLTAFREGDTIPVDGTPLAKMPFADLLRLTAENAANSGIAARPCDAYGEYLYSGSFSTGGFYEFPIRKEVGRKYKVTIDTTATLVTLYLFKHGLPGSGRNLNFGEEIEYTNADLTADRDCVRIYFNNANNDSAEIKFYVDCAGAESAKKLNNEVNGCKIRLDACERDDDGIKVVQGTYNTGNYIECPIPKVVGELYMVDLTTDASAYNIYLFKSGQSGSGRSIKNKELVEYDNTDLSVGRDCLRVYFNNASSSAATAKFYKCNDIVHKFFLKKTELAEPLENYDGFRKAVGSFSTGGFYEFPIKKEVGERYIAFVDTTATLFTVYLFKSGQSGSGRLVGNQEFFTYTDADLLVDRDCVRIYFNNANNDSAAMMLYKVNKASSTIKDVQNASKSVAILGASYCTYAGWIPEGQTPYYPINTHPDVDDVSVCWWYKVFEKMGWTLFYNDAWSGTTICNSVREGMPTLSSMVNRAESSFGSGKTLLPKPSAFILCGGINDSGLGTDVGNCMYSGWTDADLLKVAPAFCKMLDTIKKYNPGATIINISCNVSNAIDSKMQEACTHYGAKYIKVTGINGDYAINGHPNAAGMTKMATQIVDALKA